VNTNTADGLDEETAKAVAEVGASTPDAVVVLDYENKWISGVRL